MNKINIKFKLNSDGVQDLLKGSEMQSILLEKARDVAGRAGEGYSSEVRVYKKRAVGRAYAATPEAVRDNYENNTLLKALGR